MRISLDSFSRQFRSIARRLYRGLREDRGNAVVELAAGFAFIVTPLLLATAETAFIIYDSIEVSSAAQAGAMYGMISSTLASDSTGIRNAAQAEASDFGTNLTVTPTTYYACSAAITGTQYSTPAAAGAVCPANASNHYLQFVKVTSTASITPVVQFPGLPKSWTLNGVSVMEVQE